MGDMTWKRRNLHRGREFWGQHHSHRISEFLIKAQLFQVSGHLPGTPPTVDCLEQHRHGMASGASIHSGLTVQNTTQTPLEWLLEPKQKQLGIYREFMCL